MSAFVVDTMTKDRAINHPIELDDEAPAIRRDRTTRGCKGMRAPARYYGGRVDAPGEALAWSWFRACSAAARTPRSGSSRMWVSAA